MKKTILLVTPFLFFGCKTFNYPGYNINSSDNPAELESEFVDNTSSDIDFNHSADNNSSDEDGLNFSIDNINDEVTSEASFQINREESREIKSSLKKKTFIASKASKRKKQNISEENRKNKKSVHKNVKSIKKDSKQNNNTASSSRGLYIALGVIFFILSIPVIWYVSILGGALMLVGGIGMWIAGATMSKPGVSARPSSNRNQTEVQMNQMVDVVYLKNGGVRRGIIIEQVPGESLKIKTNDGSVYVFKMDEISKITKE